MMKRLVSKALVLARAVKQKEVLLSSVEKQSGSGLLLKSDITRLPGYWHEDDLRRFTAMVENVMGEFAEIGVWRGEASQKLIRLSLAQNKRTHLFDSFCGMGEPGSFDSGS